MVQLCYWSCALDRQYVTCLSGVDGSVTSCCACVVCVHMPMPVNKAPSNDLFCLWFPYKTYRRCEPHNWLCNHDRSCLSLYICGWQIVDWLCLKLCTSTCIVIRVVLTDLFWANCGMSWVNSWMVGDDKFRERLEMSVSACCDAYLERRSDILVR